MKRVFFIDIDGTILHTEPEVSSFNISALKRARENGCKIFLNTGRGKACIPEQVLALPLDGIVSGCGCTVTVNGVDVYSACPPVSAIREYLTDIASRGEHCFLEGETQLFRYNCTEELEKTDKAYAKYCADARLDYRIWKELYTPEEILLYPDARIPKLNLAGSHTEADLARFSAHYDGVLDPTKCEMYTKGNSKATGMRLVMEKYFPGYESVAIGDGVNDTEMLMAADISVAMGNAPTALKEICTTVTDTCERDGMGKAVLALSENI